MYYIGQTFEGIYPPEAADWCIYNNAMIDLINGVWTIVSAEPTEEEKKAIKRNERDRYLNDIQWRVERYDSQIKLGITPNDNEEVYMSILAYQQYLRDIPQSAGFPDVEIKTFEEWAQ